MSSDLLTSLICGYVASGASVCVLVDLCGYFAHDYPWLGRALQGDEMLRVTQSSLQGKGWLRAALLVTLAWPYVLAVLLRAVWRRRHDF